jgi:hypothetical protein
VAGPIGPATAFLSARANSDSNHTAAAPPVQDVYPFAVAPRPGGSRQRSKGEERVNDESLCDHSCRRQLADAWRPACGPDRAPGPVWADENGVRNEHRADHFADGCPAQLPSFLRRTACWVAAARRRRETSGAKSFSRPRRATGVLNSDGQESTSARRQVLPIHSRYPGCNPPPPPWRRVPRWSDLLRRHDPGDKDAPNRPYPVADRSWISRVPL